MGAAMGAPMGDRAGTGGSLAIVAPLLLGLWLALSFFTDLWAVGGSWPGRLGLLIAAALLGWSLYRSTPELLLSPLFLLGISALVFYSLLPSGLFSQLREVLQLPPVAEARAAAFIGGEAEHAILRFAVAALLMTAAHAWVARRGEPWRMGFWNMPRRLFRCAAALAAMAVGAHLFLRGLKLVPDLEQGPLAGFIHQIGDGLPAWMSIGLVATAYAAIAARDPSVRRARFRWVGLVAVAVFGTLLLGGNVKWAIWAVAAALGLILISGVYRKFLLPMAGALIVIFVVAMIGIAVIRTAPNASVPTDYAAATVRFAAHKLVSRQTETGHCLQSVLDRQYDAPALASPFYFLAGIVPRYFWPDKPNLSPGVDYAIRYCGKAPEEIDPRNPHHASLTLIGEPIARAGWAGLALALGVLAAGLSVVAALSRRSAAGMIAATALIPWLIDFDQHFALYIANALKMFIYMSPVVLVLALAERHAVLRQTES